jgi:hypothetical protein
MAGYSVRLGIKGGEVGVIEVCPNFSVDNYDNPERARNIIRDYFPNLANLSEESVKDLNKIVSNHKKCIDLDLTLNKLLI